MLWSCYLHVSQFWYLLRQTSPPFLPHVIDGDGKRVPTYHCFCCYPLIILCSHNVVVLLLQLCLSYMCPWMTREYLTLLCLVLHWYREHCWVLSVLHFTVYLRDNEGFRDLLLRPLIQHMIQGHTTDTWSYPGPVLVTKHYMQMLNITLYATLTGLWFSCYSCQRTKDRRTDFSAIEFRLKVK